MHGDELQFVKEAYDANWMSTVGENMDAAESLGASYGGRIDVGADIFAGGLCLPSDNKMTNNEQDKIIEIIKSCFGKL